MSSPRTTSTRQTPGSLSFTDPPYRMVRRWRMFKFCIFATCLFKTYHKSTAYLTKHFAMRPVLFFVIVRSQISQMGDSLTFLSGISLDEPFMLYLNYKLGSAGSATHKLVEETQ